MTGCTAPVLRLDLHKDGGKGLLFMEQMSRW